MAIDTSSLRDKPWYVAAGVGVFLGAIIVFALYWLLIRDWTAESERLNVRLSELATDIAAGRSAEQRLPQLRDEAARLELELDKLRRILPSSRNTEELIKKFKSLVDEGDFVLEKLLFPSLSETAPPPAEGQETPVEEVYAEWPVSVTLQGRYHDLAILFNRLSNFSRIVNVEQFTLSALPVQLDRTIRAEFVAKTFVYREPAPDPGSTEGTPGGGQQ